MENTPVVARKPSILGASHLKMQESKSSSNHLFDVFLHLHFRSTVTKRKPQKSSEFFGKEKEPINVYMKTLESLSPCLGIS